MLIVNVAEVPQIHEEFVIIQRIIKLSGTAVAFQESTTEQRALKLDEVFDSDGNALKQLAAGFSGVIYIIIQMRVLRVYKFSFAVIKYYAFPLESSCLVFHFECLNRIHCCFYQIIIMRS